MKNNTLLGVIVLAVSFFVIAFPAQADVEVSYKAVIHPIIHDYCLNCHEPGGKGYIASGLDMTTYESLMKGTKFGSVIKPNDSFSSILIQLVEGRAHSSIKMPYGMSGGLSKKNIELLKKWVDQGAQDN
jgi:uncharacterized membrane protein